VTSPASNADSLGPAHDPRPSHERLADVAPRVQAAVAALRSGGFVLVADDALDGAVLTVLAGAAATPENINDMVSHAAGIVGCTVDAERAVALDLTLVGPRRAPDSMPRYAVSVESREGVSTGISAGDRATTIAVLCDPAIGADDLVRPGHIMPALVDRLGTLRRPYAAEAAHDLVQIAGLDGGAAFSHVLDGTEELRAAAAPAFAAARGWPFCTASDVAIWRAATEEHVRDVESGVVQTAHGDLRIDIYESELDSTPHLALVRGDLAAGDLAPLVRVHSQCLTGDVLHSARCDCGQQLHAALDAIGQENRGVLLYLSQEGRGIGLVGKIQAYALQDDGRDTVDANLELGFAADQRDYAVAAQMLRRLGVNRVRLLTNNPQKVAALQALGIQVQDRVPLEMTPGEHNAAYLETKRQRLGHTLGASSER
jgi:3,4-dihydroxy 2-butanone 4-phosphate synthase/GTP cyclohydrolase II